MKGKAKGRGKLSGIKTPARTIPKTKVKVVKERKK